jgi:hypothetical protein
MASGCSSAQIGGLRSSATATDALIGLTAAAAVATVIVAVVELRHRGAHAAAPRRLALATDGLRF